jgi:hypothetical protein
MYFQTMLHSVVRHSKFAKQTVVCFTIVLTVLNRKLHTAVEYNNTQRADNYKFGIRYC